MARDGRLWHVLHPALPEQALMRAALHAQLAEPLPDELDFPAVLDALAARALPWLADGCALLVRAENELPQVGLAGAPVEAAAEMARELASVSPGDGRGISARDPRQAAPASGRFFADLRHAAATPDAADLRAFASLGFAAALRVPMALGDPGEGVLSLAFRRPLRALPAGDMAYAAGVARVFGGLLRTARARERERQERRAQELGWAMIGHDLKNPLSAMLMSTALMVRKSREAGSARALEESASVLHRSALRMSRLLADLEAFLHLEHLDLRLDVAPCDAGRLVRDAVEEINAWAAQKRIGVTCDIAAESLPLVCDRHRISQVLVNLLSNAVEATPVGGRVLVRARAHEDRLEVEVQDSGKGVPPEEAPHLFDAHFRGKCAHYAGKGLGLAIARSLVEAHGGRIWVEASGRAGARFAFCLPMAARDVVSPPAHMPPPAAARSAVPRESVRGA